MFKEKIINNMQDLSDEKQFSFMVECTVCKKRWISSTSVFSKANETAINGNKEIVFKALYQHEKRLAALKAVNEAHSQLNLCPVCKSIVCDSCFMICDDLDMCVECAEILHEKGELVESSANTSTLSSKTYSDREEKYEQISEINITSLQ